MGTRDYFDTKTIIVTSRNIHRNRQVSGQKKLTKSGVKWYEVSRRVFKWRERQKESILINTVINSSVLRVFIPTDVEHRDIENGFSQKVVEQARSPVDPLTEKFKD